MCRCDYRHACSNQKVDIAAIDRVSLYSNMRALKEVEIIREKFGESFIYKRTGNLLTPVPALVKMMLYKKHKPKICKKYLS